MGKQITNENVMSKQYYNIFYVHIKDHWYHSYKSDSSQNSESEIYRIQLKTENKITMTTSKLS